MQTGDSSSCPKCPPGTIARMENVTDCQTGKDTMEMRCYNPCATVLCQEGTECIPITQNCPKHSDNSSPQIKCTDECINMTNPCNNFHCPVGQECYLNRTLTPTCKLTAQCIDSCVGTSCPCGQFCYLNDKCDKPPCNPSTICREPCKGANCKNRGKCYASNRMISCPCPPCPPRELCIIKKGWFYKPKGLYLFF